MISAFGVEHSVSKSMTPDQERRARKRARRAGRTAPNAYDRLAVGGRPRSLTPVAKSQIDGAWIPITSLPKVSQRAFKNSLLARRAGKTKSVPEKPLPKYWYHKGIGRIRVTQYNGNGMFQGVDSRDNIRIAHRRNIKFGKAAGKVPDAVSVVLPGSAVRAYDNSKKHKVEAAASNVGSKTAGALTGLAVGTAVAGLAARKLPKRMKLMRTLNRDTSIKVSGRAKPFVISAPAKRGYFNSAVGGSFAGLGSTIAGNSSYKRIKSNPRYEYGR